MLIIALLAIIVYLTIQMKASEPITKLKEANKKIEELQAENKRLQEQISELQVQLTILKQSRKP